MSVEAMKQALEALEDAETTNDGAERWNRHFAAKEALRQAIEQAEQDWSIEEAALASLREHITEIKRLRNALEQSESQEPVAWYVELVAPEKSASGVQRGLFLTLEEAEIWVNDPRDLVPLYAAPPKQDQPTDLNDPVGYADKHDLERDGHDFWVSREPSKGGVPIYTAPLKREWVSLTDEEIDLAIKDCKTTDTYKYFRAIEAKLKEKNHD